MPGRPLSKKLDKHFPLRVTKGLFRAVRALAAREGRSVNSQINKMLEAYLVDPEGCEKARREAEE